MEEGSKKEKKSKGQESKVKEQEANNSTKKEKEDAGKGKQDEKKVTFKDDSKEEPKEKGAKRKRSEDANDERKDKANESSKRNRSKKDKRDDKEDGDGKSKLAEAEKGLPNSNTHHTEYLRYKRWCRNAKRFPAALASRVATEEGRQGLSADYIQCGGDVNQIMLRHTQSLKEAQKSKIRYGFRNEKWVRDHHGDAKAERIMKRKVELGLKPALNY